MTEYKFGIGEYIIMIYCILIAGLVAFGMRFPLYLEDIIMTGILITAGAFICLQTLMRYEASDFTDIPSYDFKEDDGTLW